MEENERAVDAIVARVKTEKADLESIQRVKTRLQAALIRKLDNKAGRRTAAASAARGATDAAAVAEQASGALAVATGGSGEVATATATVSRAVQLEVVLALWEADQEKKNLEQNLEKLRKVKADLDAAVAQFQGLLDNVNQIPQFSGPVYHDAPRLSPHQTSPVGGS